MSRLAARIVANVHAALLPAALLLAAVLVAALAFTFVVQAQSLLSEPVPAWLAAEKDLAVEPGSGEGEPAPGILALLAMAERGEGRVAYPHLRALFLDPRNLADPEAERDLRRRLTIALLEAGRGFAPAAEQEEAARRFVEGYPDDPFFARAFFYLSDALFRQGRPLEDSFFFDDDALHSLPPWMQTRFLTVQAEAAERRREFARAAAFRLAELESASSLRETKRQAVLETLGQIGSIEALNEFLGAHSGAEWIRAERPLLEARVLIHAGKHGEALLALENLERDGRAATPAGLKFLRDTRGEIEQAVLTRPERIGVLLPLGSSNAALREIARDALDGLRMAVQFSGPAPGPLAKLGRALDRDVDPARESAQGAAPSRAYEGGAYELVVKDSGNSAEQAARMVEELTLREHVIAIIGPIARPESQGALQRAEELGVPLISLSITAAIPDGARFQFRHNKSQEEEVRDLVRYGMDYLGARRYAILYPRNNYGEGMMEQFWQEVAGRGGQIVGVASFQTSAADDSRGAGGLQAVFDNLAGIDRFLAPIDKALLDKAGDKKPDPVVQFDALFIPIHARGGQDLRQIAPYPATVDAEKKAVLGSRNWNSDTAIVATAGKLDGAVFVDAYYKESSDAANQAFRGRHRLLFRHRADYQAPSFYTALAHDTLAMLTTLLGQPKHRSREALARALHQMEPFAGLTGLTTFIEPGYSVKESMLLKIEQGRIVRVMQ
jgi:ABC-type branched-subunit amino acid transport system substrate-binding protein